MSQQQMNCLSLPLRVLALIVCFLLSLSTIVVVNGAQDLNNNIEEEPAWIPENGTPPSQVEALIALYNSTGGPKWSPVQWNISSDPCLDGWEGIKCDQYNNVYTVSLQNNNLVGTIPSDIENLPALQFLYLSSNRIAGSIPASLGTLVGLQQVGLDQNNLTGNIPSFAKLTNLQNLFLQENQLQVRYR